MQTNTENNSPKSETATGILLTSEPLKARSEWDEDERLDGRPKTNSIHVLVVRPGAEPSPQIIGNNLEAIQAVVGGLFTTFDTGIEGVIGVANDEALVDNLPLNRMVPATGAGIFGTFFLAGDGINFHSLTQQQIEQCIEAFCEPILVTVVIDVEVDEEPNTPASNTKTTAIEVCVFAPHELPYCTVIESNPATGYLPALQRIIAGALINEVKPFGVATFDTQVEGLVGLCHQSNTDGTVLQIDANHFPPNQRVIHMPSMFYGTFVVAAGSSINDMTSLTPELLEKALDVLAPELDHSLFEQVMHSHSRGALYMGDWD